MEREIKTDADFLFEVSWEVCNKVGGINTVLKSKAAKIVEHYGDRYLMVGPYFADKVSEFEEMLPSAPFKRAFDVLKKEGVACHYGKWLVPGQPFAILLDFPRNQDKINSIKYEFWEAFGIDSTRAGYDYDEPLLWSYYVGKLLELVHDDKKTVAQFHEWLAGGGILYLKKNNIKVGTIFTTHATVLGRTLANNGVNFYAIFEQININEEVYKWCIEAKHSVESNAAKKTDVFTTVSEITGMEAQHFLGRKPDILLLNGLDLDKFPTIEESTIDHRKQREKIREFLLSYFFPYYSFEISETLFYFIAGRYEFRDKGIDVFINALGRLNERLKKEKSNTTIVAFLWVPAGVKGIKHELLENRTFFKDIKDVIEDGFLEIKRQITYLLVSKQKINNESIFSEDELLELKKKVAKLHREGTPPVATHDLYDEHDIILARLKEAKLFNTKEDNIKVIFYPVYLSGADNLLDLTYYEAMQGCHLGVFPSFYEPWGYTPLEAGALGVASVATDLSGFGRYVEKLSEQKKRDGIVVLKRFQKSDEEVTSDLSKILYDFSQLSRQDRIENKMEARHLAATADWKFFIKNYLKAHNLAVKKTYG
jgi:glycogen(starch) synthase